jgi:hypothetical protein
VCHPSSGGPFPDRRVRSLLDQRAIALEQGRLHEIDSIEHGSLLKGVIADLDPNQTIALIDHRQPGIKNVLVEDRLVVCALVAAA